VGRAVIVMKTVDAVTPRTSPLIGSEDFFNNIRLGLFAVALVASLLPESALVKWSGWLMLAGILLFSGSLYLLSITGIRWLGAITPLGGVAFISAWLLLAVAVVKG